MDCINQILSFYNDTASKENQDSQEVKVWSLNTLRRLMETLNSEKDHLRVKNCLLLVLNLFFDLDSPDNLSTKGKSAKELSSAERRQMCDLLKMELNN
jgi:hypothetical protein